jgi:NAD(P)-dependent dehydrogenase (short-subunit alcohol dehydrogenase family)
MGMVSFYFCDAAREAGAVIAAGVPIAQIVPGEGVVLEGGERITEQPSGKFTTVEQVGALAVFLCSPGADNITGVPLLADGGWTAQEKPARTCAQES